MNAKQNPSLTNTGRFFSSGVVAVAFLLGLQAQPLLASDQVPFRASFSTLSETEFVPPGTFVVTVIGDGKALHMGKTSSFTIGTITPTGLTTATGASTATVTAANGDQIVFENTFAGGFAGVAFVFEGTYTVVGGTGRFAGVTGSGRMVGFSRLSDSVGEFQYIGTISSPGSAN
ncbi:MAG: hypothetical protein L0Z50_23240 [Verrucomicrobiales bacterium]|nr:hypothetical protein [Verrucomicrobiales bacterium]